jgi:mRNA-degrading endonuclease RelE of RelBE toxin-antitoxin system
MAYNQIKVKTAMVIVETSIFTRQVQVLLSDDEYRQLQMTLVLQPDLGVIIPGSGGLRKARWTIRGRGKRGGVRVIYYWAVVRDTILMLFIYTKNEQDDLTSDQLKVLRRIVEEEYS